MSRYIVTAAYADHLGDSPQVYETDVEADSIEEAELAAQEQCIADNCWEEHEEWGCYDGANGQSRVPGPLVDIYARPVADNPLMESIIRALIDRGVADESYVRERMQELGEDKLWESYIAPMLDTMAPNFERED